MPPIKPEHFREAMDKMPPTVRAQIQLHPGEVVVAGGFIRSIVTGEPINDIDVFVRDEPLAKALAEELSAQEENHPEVSKSVNAWNVAAHPYKVQYVHCVHMTPRVGFVQVLDAFDFTNSQAVITMDFNTLTGYTRDDFYPDCEAKRLQFINPLSAAGNLRALKRALKFVSRGWTISDENLTQIIRAFVPTLTNEKVKDALNPLYREPVRTVPTTATGASTGRWDTTSHNAVWPNRFDEVVLQMDSIVNTLGEVAANIQAVNETTTLPE